MITFTIPIYTKGFWFSTLSGLIRAGFAVEDSKYKSVTISGDFFCFPRDSVDRLANMLEDYPVANISNAIADYYQSEEIDIPGITLADWLQVFNI